MNKTVCIAGAGTMGRGIAQVAATAGWNVQLYDQDKDASNQAIDSIGKRINRLVEKGLLTASDGDTSKKNLNSINSIKHSKPSSLVIEAIAEDLQMKVDLFKIFKIQFPTAIFATNTSSLSVTELGEKAEISDRLIGLHFFNPAPLMKLVEVIQGKLTPPKIRDQVICIASEWGKTVVSSLDCPGFIVNRVARPFYLESWRCLESSIAGITAIDRALTDIAGFRMGPFTLTDLIGQDINVATTQSIFQRLNKPPRLAPSCIQEKLVEKGYLGRKTSRGAYAYSDEDIVPAIFEKDTEIIIPSPKSKVVTTFAKKAGFKNAPPIASLIACRVLASIINEAWWVQHENVASSEEIDIAMKLGTGYPKGPLEWSKEIGEKEVRTMLAAMSESVSDERYATPC